MMTDRCMAIGTRRFLRRRNPAGQPDYCLAAAGWSVGRYTDFVTLCGKAIEMNPGREQRERMIRRNTELIEMAYVRAVTDGVEKPVVFVLDTRDPVATELIRAAGHERDPIHQLEEKAGPGDIPTAFVAFEQSLAVRIVDEFSPNNARALAALDPDNGFPVVAVGSGGSLLHVKEPIPETD